MAYRPLESRYLLLMDLLIEAGKADVPRRITKAEWLICATQISTYTRLCFARTDWSVRQWHTLSYPGAY